MDSPFLDPKLVLLHIVGVSLIPVGERLVISGGNIRTPGIA